MLTRAAKLTLDALCVGKRTSELAREESVTLSAIHHRLAIARRKLGARTILEAAVIHAVRRCGGDAKLLYVKRPEEARPPTHRELAKKYNVSRKTIQRWLARGSLRV